MAGANLLYLVLAAVAVVVAWLAVGRSSSQQKGTAAGETPAVKSFTLGTADLDNFAIGHILDGIALPRRTYFFSVGSLGGDSAKKQRVLQAMTKLSSLKPQFMLSLGDNFFPRGVKDLDDPILEESFEKVFRGGHLAAVPWKMVLGDEEHRGNVTALLQHGNRSSLWSLPSLFHSLELPIPDDSDRNLEIDFIDSTLLERGLDKELVASRRHNAEYDEAIAGDAASKEHWRWLEARLRSTRPALRLVVAHRPVVSVVDEARTPSEQRLEGRLQEVLLTATKKSAVVYLHGHDKALQHWESADKITHLGVGSGGSGLQPLRPFPDAPVFGAELRWATNTTYGFAVHELSGQALNTYFIEADSGEVVYVLRAVLPDPPARPAEEYRPLLSASVLGNR